VQSAIISAGLFEWGVGLAPPAAQGSIRPASAVLAYLLSPFDGQRHIHICSLGSVIYGSRLSSVAVAASAKLGTRELPLLASVVSSKVAGFTESPPGAPGVGAGAAVVSPAAAGAAVVSPAAAGSAVARRPQLLQLPQSPAAVVQHQGWSWSTEVHAE
jgi:hypothetical protein